jgi:hypothetical protein
MDIIFCRGGCKNAPAIALASGMLYGTRHDYTPYAPVFMLDINWHKFDWQDYVSKVKLYQPVMAMVPDYERPTQRRALYRCIRDVKPLVQRVMVCPKFVGAVAHIPSWCIVAVSVPTSYAGFLPDFRELVGRKVHLLGGRPEVQAQIIRQLNGVGATVVSVDGSYHALKAGFGQWFDGGTWSQLRRGKVSDTDLSIASGKNIVRYLQNALKEQQMSLFEALAQ